MGAERLNARPEIHDRAIVLLVGLGAYIYFVTWKTPEGDTGGKKLDKVFATLQADKIEDITVTTAAGDATVLKKDASGWQLTSPLATTADQGEVSGMTNALSSLEVVRVIDENPTNLNDYGLSNPRIEIDFKAGDKTAQAAHRREVADRIRSVRETRRREEGVPDSRDAGNDLQPDHVRPAREDAAEVRS